jgi:hypothetical protein
MSRWCCDVELNEQLNQDAMIVDTLDYMVDDRTWDMEICGNNQATASVSNMVS